MKEILLYNTGHTEGDTDEPKYAVMTPNGHILPPESVPTYRTFESENAEMSFTIQLGKTYVTHYHNHPLKIDSGKITSITGKAALDGEGHLIWKDADVTYAETKDAPKKRIGSVMMGYIDGLEILDGSKVILSLRNETDVFNRGTVPTTDSDK